MQFKRSTEPDNSLANVHQTNGFLSKLMGGSEFCHPIKFKVLDENGVWKDEKGWMRLLTVQENLEIEDQVNEEFKEQDSIANTLKKSIRTIQLTLVRAITVEQKEQIGDENALINIPDTHFNQLYSIYTELCAKYDPAFEKDYDDATINKIVNEIEKKSLALKDLSRYELVMVIKYLISDRIELKDNIATLSSVDYLQEE